jgi:helicase MOV-10
VSSSIYHYTQLQLILSRPGTGKTVTIIEAMRQLLATSEDIRILACAPSNSAADLIASHLAVLGPSTVLRLNSLSRKFDDLPRSLREFSLYNSNNVFAMPTLEQIRTFRVVVATCITAGAPNGLGLPSGWFTHIFIDEAGQATEPESMIPIKSMASRTTNIILAGDPKQLGPIVQSPVAGVLGLKKSYLSRLMELDIYQVDSEAGSKITSGGRGVT